VSEGYSTQYVKVGARLVSFTGRELVRVRGAANERTEEQRGQDFTLYETPDEGRKLYVQEWRIKANTERKTLETAAEIERTGVLYSEEEANQKHPEVLEELSKLARD
jgi:hypothetical protein